MQRLPAAIEQGLAGVASRTSNQALAKMATKGAEYLRNTDGKGLTGLKKVGGQTALDFGIKQAELNEKAIAEYESRFISKEVLETKQKEELLSLTSSSVRDTMLTKQMQC